MHHGTLQFGVMLALLAASVVSGKPVLRFHPDFSPPDEATSAIKPFLYKAYNRPAFSQISRPIKIIIEDEDGNRITEGPDSELTIALHAISYNTGGVIPTPINNAQETTILNGIIARQETIEMLKPDIFMTNNPQSHAGTIHEQQPQLVGHLLKYLVVLFFSLSPLFGM